MKQELVSHHEANVCFHYICYWRRRLKDMKVSCPITLPSPSSAMETELAHVSPGRMSFVTPPRADPDTSSQHWSGSCCSFSPIHHLCFFIRQPTAVGPEQGENASWWMEPDHRNPDTLGKGNTVFSELRPAWGKMGGMKMNGSGENRG